LGRPVTTLLTILPSLPALIAFVLLAACGSLPPISTTVDYCCQAPMPGLRTFRVEFENMPEFLKPMLRDEAAIVLDTKGLDYTEGDAHAVLRMIYVHNLIPPEKAPDGFSETLSPGGATRFVAEVKVELRDTVSGELVWSGNMVRAHYVQMGSYMHDAMARSAMREAFVALFDEFPVALADYPVED
jgi:hypothetical protein